MMRLKLLKSVHTPRGQPCECLLRSLFFVLKLLLFLHILFKYCPCISDNWLNINLFKYHYFLSKTICYFSIPTYIAYLNPTDMK